MELLSSIASTVFSAIITQGGWGAIIAAAMLFWNIKRTNLFEKKESAIKDDADVIRDMFLTRETELKEKVLEMEKAIIALQSELKEAEKTIYILEKERIADLKAMLSEYYSTATDTLHALEKFEFFIINRR
jgi:hypothetical protein